MFLTVGDKTKLCRKKYHLKQAIFESYGITQYYLSLIENNKRNPSDEMVESIYKALVDLTDGKVCLDYSYTEFKKSLYTQAKEWLNQQYKIRGIYDEDLFEVAKEFNVVEVIYEIYQQLGNKEQEEKNYQKSNEYFQEAIQCALQLNKSPLDLYKKMATNLKMNLNNEGALAYYRLALNYVNKDEDKYKLMYYMGFIEANLGNVDKALGYADENIKCSRDKLTVIGSILLKEHTLRKMGEFQKGREVLENYLKSPLGEDLIDHIYYNLAVNYKEDSCYSEALGICFELLGRTEQVTSDIRYKTILLIGAIYRHMREYEEGLIFIKSIKSEILKEKEQRFIRWFYETYLEILISLNLEIDIIELVQEINFLVKKRVINQDIFNYIYSKVIQYVVLNKKFDRFGEILIKK
ncbi:MAG: hypothetical protein Q3980_01035 [Turicibacter sp.]|nr:hypothetical protein [Turicibacter sp.]